jgi:phospholipid/cholesterol/gamma-HCH transport system substrate-binding protein
METRASYVVVGGFVITLVITLIVAAFWVARVQLAGQETYYDIYFVGSVTGLVQGAAVRYNGIPVGRITKIELDPLDPQRVRVTVEITSTTEIKTDVTAELSYQGLTGGAFIELSGGTAQAPPLVAKNGERYPVILSKQSTLQKFVDNAPEVLNKVVEVTTHLNQILDEQNRKALADTLAHIEQVTGAVASRSDDITQLLDNLAVASKDLNGTIDAATATINSAHEVVAPGSDLRDALHKLDILAGRLDDAGGHLDALIQENRPSIHEFATRGLGQVEDLLSDARVLVAQLTRVAQSLERDPSRLLYGDRRQGYQPK